MTIIRGSDNSVKLLGPHKESDGSALDFTNAGATSTFELYDDRRETRIIPARTRLQADAVIGLTFTIPHIVPQWLESGDSILIIGSDGEKMRRIVNTITPGTDELTPATNFDTVAVTVALSEASSKGSEVTLVKKGSGAVVLPIYVPRVAYAAVAGFVVEVQQDDLTVKSGILDGAWDATISTEDGAIALDQDEYPILQLAAGITTNVSVERRIRNKLTVSPIAMSEFPSGGAGTPPNPDTWRSLGGFVGTIPDTDITMDIGDQVRVEITFDGGAGLKLILASVEPVIEHGG